MPTLMLHTLTRNVRAESIVFEDSFQTSCTRLARAFARRHWMTPRRCHCRIWMIEQAWVVTMNGAMSGAIGVVYNFNRRTVHQARPSGGSLQTMAMIRCLSLSSSRHCPDPPSVRKFRGCRSRGPLSELYERLALRSF